MKITINNVALELQEGATLQDALNSKGISAAGIATAVNGTVIPANQRHLRELSENDNIIIIKAFYGG